MFKNFSNYLLPSVIALSALSVSVSAAFYSISGLSKLFAGASTEVIIMAGALEASKLVLATLLHQYWNDLGKLLRTYLMSAVVVLILITSMGIYGFLSAAYQETANKSSIVDTRIAFLEQKKDFYQDDVTRYDTELERISTNITTLSQAKSRDIQVRDTSSATGFRNTISTTELRLAQQRIESEEENRRLVQVDRSEAADSLQKYQVLILEANVDNDIAAELGPLKFLSGLTGISMDRIINILLLIIIFVFDPLAVSMVIAANYAFDIARTKSKKDIPAPKDKNWEEYIEQAEVSVEKNAPEEQPKAKDWEIEKDPIEDDPEEVKLEFPKTKKVVKVLQRTPTKRRVLFDDGKEGWVNKGDEDKIIYL